MDEIHETWLVLALKINSISLKNTVTHFGKAKAKPIEMKAPATTAQPQPPSGGVCDTGSLTAGIDFGFLVDPHHTKDQTVFCF